MNSKIISKLLICFITLNLWSLSTSCSKGIANSHDYSGDTLVVETMKLSDSSSYVKANGEKCAVIAEVTLAIPSSCKDAETIEALRKLYVRYLLDASDSLSIVDAAKQCVNNTLRQYDAVNAPGEDELVDDDTTPDTVKVYHNCITVNVYYNQHGIVTFCKTEIVKKDEKATSVTHRYFNFDIEGLCHIGLNQLFKEELLPNLCGEMKSRLAGDNKVADIEQLNEIGYYNIDNLTVTDNFYFGENGVTWSFLPDELAVAALGEPTITLDYTSLEPYVSDKSIIKRLY